MKDWDWVGIAIAAAMFLVASVVSYAILQLLFPWLPYPAGWFPR